MTNQESFYNIKYNVTFNEFDIVKQHLDATRNSLKLFSEITGLKDSVKINCNEDEEFLKDEV